MAQFLHLALLWTPDRSLESISEAQFRIQSALGLSPDYISLSFWRDLDFPEQYAFVFHTHSDSNEPGQGGLGSAAVEMETLATSLGGSLDSHQILLDHLHAAAPGQIQVGQFMSVSKRKADPGHSDDLRAELRDIFESIKYIDGYLGSAIGTNLAVEEEVVGIVFWKSREAFQESVPRGSFYEIRLYERVS